MQLLQHQKQQLRSCYSQQRQLSKAGECYFATTRNNKRKLSEDRQNSTLTQHDRQLSKKGKTQLQLLKYQEQHGFTKSSTMGKRQRIV